MSLILDMSILRYLLHNQVKILNKVLDTHLGSRGRPRLEMKFWKSSEYKSHETP